MKRFFLYIVFLFFVACAQQNQPLSGGPQDTTPPVIKRSIPVLNDTNFTGQEIVIKFNEFFTLKNIEAEFIASPPFEEKPKFKVKGKKLIIKIKEPLLDSVTYLFSFGNSIADYHENNILKNFQFTFSTYDSIDTLHIEGKIIDAYNFDPVQNVDVMLYSMNIDSLPFISLPLYITKTDSSGNFIFSNLQSKNYKIFALEDLNKNLKYDIDESNIAFLDTTIKPWAETIVQYDTIDSGSVVVSPVNDTLTDTLTHDSIIITHKTFFHPNDITLLFFTEESSIQEIKRLTRTFKGFIQIFFVKQLINNYLKIYSIDSTGNFSFLTEKFKSNDSIFLWLTNPNFYSKDTISFIAEYYIDDTTLTQDTITFFDYDYGTDTVNISIKNYQKKISTFDNLKLFCQTPITDIDTNKIKLYQIVDTLVSDLKEQKVTAIRPQFDSLIFAFSRPIVKNFFLKFEDYKNNDIPVIWKKNSTNDTVFCKIVNTSLSNTDTLRFTAYFDNLYFYNQIQELNQDFELPISEQKIISLTRKQQDSIIITFQKNIPYNINLELIDNQNYNYNYLIQNNKLYINLTDSSLIDIDTLLFAVNFIDRKDQNGDTIFFNDTAKCIFVFNRQKITYARRYYRSKIILIFKKTWLQRPEIELLSFNPLRKWYKITSSRTNDTLHIDIINERVKRLNNMTLKVSYFDINQHKDTLFFNDTLHLKIEKADVSSKEIIGQEKSLTLQKPIKYTILQDSDKIRELNIKTIWESGAKYKLQIDSAAFFGLYGNTNDTTTINFQVFASDEFAHLIIDIKNIWAILDTLGGIDTSEFYTLPEGQLMLIIEDQNNEVYKSISFNSDKKIKDEMFIPGTYSLKIFYDKNKNGIWDTGNYLKHRQPERVFFYKEKISLNPGDDKVIIWDFYEHATQQNNEN